MLGSLAASSTIQTHKGHYSDFPSLKRFFQIEHGTATVEAICAVSGTKFVSMPWTATTAFSGYMQVLNESIHHNINLAEGTWPQISDGQESIWLVCGKFDGVYSFGFGDSISGQEFVFSQLAGLPVVAFSEELVSGGSNSQFVPSISDVGALPALDSTVTSMHGVIHKGNEALTCFITDTDGNYYEHTDELLYDFVNPTFPATYSMGRDVITSGLSGIIDLSAIAVFVFDDGIPSDYKEAIEWMRTQWATGRKVIWPSWRRK